MAGKIYRVIELIEKSTDQASNSLKGSVNTNQGSDLVAVLGGMALSGQNMGTHGGAGQHCALQEGRAVCLCDQRQAGGYS